jgi:arylsulfatase A-like enzyme
MYRLIAVSAQQFLNKWVLLSVCCGIVIVVAIFSLKLLRKVISGIILIQIKNTRLFKALTLGIGCTAIFAYCLRQIHLFYLQDKAQILRLMVYFLLLITVALSGWLLFKLKINIIDKILNLKILRGAFVCLIATLILLNLGIYVDGKFNTPTGPNIIMIVVDCLRADHLGCYGYGRNTSPTIDKLAAQGIVFNNAYSNAPHTIASFASLFTSLLPNVHNTINQSDVFHKENLTIAKVLKNDGYQTFYFNGGNPNTAGQNFISGFDEVFFQVEIPAPDQYITNGNKVTDLVVSFLSGINEKKFFTLIHYMDTHTVYHKNEYNNLFLEKTKTNTFLEPGFSTLLPGQIRKMFLNNMLSVDDINYLISLYDGQIRFVDENLKRIVEALKKNNLFDDTVVIITADHGEEFFDHNNFGHGQSLYNELLRIPLIITGPTMPHREVRDNVILIDLFPTILDIADINKSLFPFLQGRSLLGLMRGEKADSERSIFATATLFGDEKYCIISANNKLILNTYNNKNKRPLFGYSSQDGLELYDLSIDPNEKINIAAKKPQLTAQLQKELAKYMNPSTAFERRSVPIDAATKDKLKALGYVQ